jgi:hypothetical protein
MIPVSRVSAGKQGRERNGTILAPYRRVFRFAFLQERMERGAYGTDSEK